MMLVNASSIVLIYSITFQSLEMVQSNKNRPLRCLAIMWAVGQTGIKDLSRGLKGII